MTAIDNSEDVLDVRDIIARYEELEALFDGREDGGISAEEVEEMNALKAFLDGLKGYGGDEQWEGDWYPATLIRDTYFEDYARELVEETGDMPDGFPSYIEIDWEATARNIRIDYSACEFDGVTYWYR